MERSGTPGQTVRIIRRARDNGRQGFTALGVIEIGFIVMMRCRPLPRACGLNIHRDPGVPLRSTPGSMLATATQATADLSLFLQQIGEETSCL